MKMKGILKHLATLTIMAALVLCLLPMMSMTAFAESNSATYTDGVYVLEVTNYDEYTQTGERVRSIKLLGIENVDISINTSNQIVCSFKLRFIDAMGQECTTDYSFSFTVENKICTEAISHSFEATYGKSSSTTYVVAKGTLTRAARTEHTGDATCIAKAKCSVCGEEYGEVNPDAHIWGDWTYSNGKHSRTCTLDGTHKESANCTRGENDRCTVCETNLVASLTSGSTVTYYGTADEAFAAANAAKQDFVTILEDATLENGAILMVDLVVKQDAVLTLNLSPFLVVEGDVSGGGTITATDTELVINGCTGCTFNLPVTTYGIVTGGIFNKSLVNYGIVQGGTFNGNLKNAKGYNANLDEVAGHVWANDLFLGENFTYTADEGTTLSCSHKHGTPATCVAPQTCRFGCTNLQSVKPHAHSLSYAAADNVITETCAHGCAAPATATLEINTGSVTYNGTAQTIETSITYSATWRGERLRAQYENNTNVGTATVYIQAGEAKAVKTFAITKATPTLEHFDITLPQNAVYDGTEKAATIDPKAGVEGMGEVSIKYYQGEKELNETPTNAGTYTVEFTVTEGSNYLPAKLLAGSFNIAKAEAITTAPTANTLTYNSKPQQLVSGGISNWGSIEYKLDNGDWSYSIPTATNAGSYTVYYRIQLGENFNNVAETAIPVELAPFNFATATAGNAKIGLLGTPFVYDGTAKTGTPSVVVTLPSADPGSSSIEVNLTEGTDFTVDYENNVKAGTFTATFTGKGNYTGVVTRNYEIAKAPLTLKVEDQTITYGESVDQAEYTVEGLADGDKATVKLTPSTTNITESGTITAEITIKNAAGEDVTGCYDISKNSGKLTINPDLSAIKDLTVDNVHHSDEEDIKAVQDMLDKAEADVKNDQNITEAQQKCANLLVQIHKSLDALRTDAIEDTLGTTASNVKLADKATINEAIGDIKEAKTNYAGNYSEADIAALDAQIANLEAALKAIENAEKVIGMMNDLPADVEPDDAKAIEAKAAYDELTSNEKNMVASATATKLAALSTYKIVKGDKATWEKGKTLTFTINGDINRFTGVKVNGSTVNSKYYTAKAGSTIVTLEKSFFEQKSISSKATHEIIFMFGDGEVRGTFYIHKDAMTPATGDSSGIVLWTVILFASTAALAAVIVISRKRKNA